MPVSFYENKHFHLALFLQLILNNVYLQKSNYCFSSNCVANMNIKQVD